MITETIALIVRDLKRWYRTPAQIILVFTTPLMWLLLFGQAFNIGKLAQGDATGMDLRIIFGGAPDYFSFMAVGQTAFIMLFASFFSGVSILWDRKFGFLSKLQVAPIPRSAIPLSRIASTLVKSMLQATVVIILAASFILIPGLSGLRFSPSFGIMDALGMGLFLALLGIGLAALFVALGLVVRNEETLFGLINLLNFPLMFTSSALIPITLMPDWLRTVALYNPITFVVDGMRQLVFSTDVGAEYSIAVDLLGISVFSALMVVLGAVLARRALLRS
ncbi:MAG: ABC transporter permease [Thermoplasmata archaeon]|nr:ABC transporter permease [Thermoplasmata archaeon]